MKKSLKDIFKSMKEKNTNVPIDEIVQDYAGKSKHIRIKNPATNKRGKGG